MWSRRRAPHRLLPAHRHPEETTGILCSPLLRVARATLGQVGLILFMHVIPGPRGYRRGAASFWEVDDQGRHRAAFRWNAKADVYEPTAKPRDAAGLGRYREFLQGLLDEGKVTLEEVQRQAVKFTRAENDSGKGTVLKAHLLTKSRQVGINRRSPASYYSAA
jgi:dsDNA-binding SOS-regulon protein